MIRLLLVIKIKMIHENDKTKQNVIIKILIFKYKHASCAKGFQNVCVIKVHSGVISTGI